MMSMRFRSLVGAALSSVLLLSCARTDEPPSPEVVRLPVAEVTTERRQRLQPYAGSIRASAIATLSARVPGDVIAVHVIEGDRVTKGQLLIDIDSRDASSQVARAHAGRNEIASAIGSAAAAVRSAEAQAALAENSWRRLSALRERGSVSIQELDEAQTRHRSASAELDRARQTHAALVAQRGAADATARHAAIVSSYSRIRAPFDGVVTARLVDPGVQAGPGLPLLTIDSARGYRFEGSVDESAGVTIGDEVTVEMGGLSASGRISSVVPSVDPRTRSALVHVSLPQDRPWRSGAFGQLFVRAGSYEALIVPTSAVKRRGQLSMVYVVGADGLTQLRLVTLGDPVDDRTVVLSGLRAGERVVAVANSIREGMRVEESRA